MSKITDWNILNGEQQDVVISSRVRLARNLKNIPFPDKMTEQQRADLNEMVLNAAGSDFEAVYLDKISPEALAEYAEKGIISRKFAADTKNRLLLISKQLPVCVMVGEEDHLRIVSIVPGMDIASAYNAADSVDNALCSRLNYAFDERLGYLTACPTNLGTGMRASVMLHLPLLNESRVMGRIASSLSQIGIAAKPCYTDSLGDIFMFSNRITLGLDEKGAIDNLANVVAGIISQERESREAVKENIDFADRLYRAMGILSSARKLSYEEFLRLVSIVRMGVYMGALSDITEQKVNAIINTVRHLEYTQAGINGGGSAQLDIERAQEVRRALE